MMAADRPDKSDMPRKAWLLQAYGADPRRWPPADRGDGAEVTAATTEATAEAAKLDALLDAATSIDPSPELMARVLAASPAAAGRSGLFDLWPFGPLWRPAAALAAAMVLGIVVGVAEPGVSPFAADDQWSAVQDASDLAYGADLDWEERS